MIHPLSWVDIIIGVLIADAFIYTVRSTLHFISNRNHNKLVAQRVSDMRPAALDSYRARQERDKYAPLG